MGSSNETSYFGPVQNPWDHDAACPAARSGGSAAAVAARLAPAATGTDTGGSIRQPASLSRHHRHQADLRRVSRYGMIAFASSLDQAGVLAQSAEDAALLLGAMAGFDPRDSTSVDTPVPDYVGGARTRRSTGLRIGLLKEFFGEGPRRRRRASCIREALEVLREARREAASRSACRTCRCRCRPTTSSRRPSARRTCRASTACASATAASDPQRPAGHVQALARRRLRRRGQAPHHDRHLRAVGRLLRRLLPEGAAGAAADRRRLRARVRAKCDVLMGPTAPTPRSRSARRPTIPSRCT